MRAVVSPQAAAGLLAQYDFAPAAVADDGQLAMALANVLARVGIRPAFMPLDFDAVRSALAGFSAGPAPSLPLAA